METLKMFENLSESEKIKFFEVLQSLFESKRVESFSTNSPPKWDLNVLLKILKSGPLKFDEILNPLEISPVDNSNKKQKTLDSWLIKNNNQESLLNTRKRPVQILNGTRLIADKNSDLCVNSTSEISYSQQAVLNNSSSNLSNVNEVCIGHKKNTPKLERNLPVVHNSLELSPKNTEIHNLNSEPTYNLRSRRKCSKLSSNNEIKEASSGSSVQIQESANYEAFCKLSTECSKIGLSLDEVLQNEKIQNLLSNYEKFHNDAVIFLGTFEAISGRSAPVVHIHESKSKLLDSLNKVCKQ